jgi:hypothetical protein
MECAVIDALQKEIVWQWMEKNKVCKIKTYFNGEGDSGSFDAHLDLRFTGDASIIEKDIVYTSAIEDLFLPVPSDFKEPISMTDYVIHLSEIVENKTPHGKNWWDDHGGDGWVEWILKGYSHDGRFYKKGINLTVRERIIEYNESNFSIQGEVDEEETA